MELAAFRALLTPQGQRLLETACAEYSESNALALSGRLRRDHPADVVAAALTQARLRQQARAKFGDDADRMYFTPDGYEQATRARVAEHRAARFAAADMRHVADLGCGIGADLLALARAGPEVTGIDLEPLQVAVANANVTALGLHTRAHAYQADARGFDLSWYHRSTHAAVFVDPSRRTGRGRVFDPSAYNPPWELVRELLTGAGCAKVAPGLEHRMVPDHVEAEWVSDDGGVKEAALWSGALRTSADRRASVLPTGATLTDADDPVGDGEPPTSPPRAYLYEPDGAVIRAGLVTAVADAVDGALLDPQLAYVTSERLAGTPFARAYRVEEVLPFDIPAIRAALRARAAGTVTVKKRGIDTDPALFRRKLRASGPNAATLVLARVERGALALLVEPVRASSSAAH